ncbi:MAG: hypothetical protein SOV56_02035 [Phascolarctobacterium sp.]|nr:hypothetical protein [Phascolarctobacterium sp.]
MKKVLRYLLMTVLVVCCSIPCLNAAEAATVALLPLINNVGGDELANKVYYNNAIKALKSQPGFVVIENNKLNEAIDNSKYAEAGMSQGVLAKIAKEGDVDIVFVMQLDKLSKKPMNRVGERMVKLDMLGKAAAYNRLNGVYYTHNMRGDKEIDETLTSRWDWVHEEFGRAVRIEINRALRAK